MFNNPIENVQVYPSRLRIELNDKATKILFNITPEYYAQMIQDNKGYGIIEKKHHKKHGKIRSKFHIFNEYGYTVIIELNEFDRAVFSVCISEWQAGNRYITIPMILRGLIGKVGDSAGFRVSKEQRTAILQSIDKLMFTAYDPNMIDAFQKLNYDGEGKIEKVTKSAILPCYRVEKTINGQKSDIIYFDRESPLFTIASLKKQILSYDVSLLDVPNQNNTPLVITLKNYSLRRIVEIKKHKMIPTLTLDDIFKKCRIEDNRKAKEHSRECLDKFFAHLQIKGEIKSYEWVKKYTKICSIKFTY